MSQIDETARRDAQAKLSRAYANNQLSEADFNSRVERVWNATDFSELAALTAGLETEEFNWPLVKDSHVSDEPATIYYSSDEPGTSLTVAVLSGQDRVGSWTVPQRHTSISVMGGSKIDLRYARFTSTRIEISCWAIMGDIEIIVPPEMAVEIDGYGVMGDFDWKKDSMAVPFMPPSPQTPKVKVTGLAMMAGVEVIRKER